MATKRKDGLLTESFTFDGQRYYVYGRSSEELFEKRSQKMEQLKKRRETRENPTVAEYYKKWIDRRRGTVSEATIRGQNNKFKTASHVWVPETGCNLGDIKLQRLKVDDLILLQRQLSENHVSRGVNDILALFKQMLKDAVNERMIDYNPAALVKPLKRTEPQARNTYHRALTKEEQKTFFESEIVQKSFYCDIFKIAMLTGMRIGEIGALKYSDIHGGFIHVERTITRTEAGGYKVGIDAKTEAGRRKIPLTDKMRQVLKHQKEINSMLDHEIPSTDDLIFRCVRRGLLKPHPVDRELKRICTALDIEPFTAHAFRDTFATRAIEQGIEPKTLQEIMGHSDISITLNLYAHCLDDTKTEAMNRIHIAI